MYPILFVANLLETCQFKEFWVTSLGAFTTLQLYKNMVENYYINTYRLKYY